MKILKINTCNECAYYKSCSSAISSIDYCYHPEIINGIFPEKLVVPGDNSLDIPIPEWCPLEDYKNK